MLLTGLAIGSVRIVKNWDLGLENAALGNSFYYTNMYVFFPRGHVTNLQSDWFFAQRGFLSLTMYGHGNGGKQHG